MHPDVFELAATKASGDTDHGRLQALSLLARRHQALADSFDTDINASRAARGEAPTALGRGRREQLSQFAREAELGHRELVASLAQVATAREIVEIVFPAMEDDVAFAAQLRRHSHPGDLPVIEAFAAAKVALHDAMSAYLLADSGVVGGPAKSGANGEWKGVSGE